MVRGVVLIYCNSEVYSAWAEIQRKGFTEFFFSQGSTENLLWKPNNSIKEE